MHYKEIGKFNTFTDDVSLLTLPISQIASLADLIYNIIDYVSVNDSKEEYFRMRDCVGALSNAIMLQCAILEKQFEKLEVTVGQNVNTKYKTLPKTADLVAKSKLI